MAGSWVFQYWPFLTAALRWQVRRTRSRRPRRAAAKRSRNSGKGADQVKVVDAVVDGSVDEGLGLGQGGAVHEVVAADGDEADGEAGFATSWVCMGCLLGKIATNYVNYTNYKKDGVFSSLRGVVYTRGGGWSNGGEGGGGEGV